jgi:CDGSH-type Zn-finger protein
VEILGDERRGGSVERAAEQTEQISVTEDGPYMVEGRVEVKNAQGEVVSVEGKIFLCRCGGSHNKPFCDGTHAKKGFSGTEVADRGPIENRRDTYVGNGITIYDDRSICAHAGQCTDNLPSVWKLGTEPWIDPQGADAEQIADVVKLCPSGALTYAVDDDSKLIEEQLEPAIEASKDGPYRVSGGIHMTSSGGESYERRNRQTLCRCGESKNKPYCDGTHWYVEFKDPA